jgi:hypothetical protein
MFGCCHAIRVKFQDEAGRSTPARLDELMRQLLNARLKPAQIEFVKQCTCPCHRDGINCMC